MFLHRRRLCPLSVKGTLREYFCSQHTQVLMNLNTNESAFQRDLSRFFCAAAERFSSPVWNVVGPV